MSRTFGALAAAAIIAFALALAGCGGGDNGTAPTGEPHNLPLCPASGDSSLTKPCRSPDGAWRLTLRHGTANGRLSLARRGQNNGVEMYHSNNACCTFLTWAKPHLLLFLDYPLVETLDPVTRTVTLLGDLNGFDVSPDGHWVADAGAAGPNDPVAHTVYVLGVGARKCLVVPGTSVTAAGFTPDSRAVIVQRQYDPDSGEFKLRQFDLSSLDDDCPPRQVETQRSTSIGS